MPYGRDEHQLGIWFCVASPCGAVFAVRGLLSVRAGGRGFGTWKPSAGIRHEPPSLFSEVRLALGTDLAVLAAPGTRPAGGWSSARQTTFTVRLARSSRRRARPSRSACRRPWPSSCPCRARVRHTGRTSASTRATAYRPRGPTSWGRPSPTVSPPVSSAPAHPRRSADPRDPAAVDGVGPWSPVIPARVVPTETGGDIAPP